MFYCKASLPVSGLGNRLFPWARARIFSHLHGLPMFAPRWTQLKVGQWLRRERDPRTYHNLFVPKKGDTPFWHELALECVLARFPEPTQLDQMRSQDFPRSGIFLFEGHAGYFRKVQGWNDFLFSELRSITREEWLARSDSKASYPIGIHVRRGDFRRPNTPEEMFTSGNLQTPLTWFISTLNRVRQAMGFCADALVFSDGTSKELRDLLSEPNVTLVTEGSAISDLFQLSKARMLIASGGSSFSAWASFFGQMPTISHPGQSLRWYGLTHASGAYVGEFDPNLPNPDLLDQVRNLSR